MKQRNVFFDFAMPVSTEITEVPAPPRSSLLFQKHPAVVVVLEGNILFNNIRSARLFHEHSAFILEGNTPAMVSSRTDGANAVILILSLNIDYYQKKYPALSAGPFFTGFPHEEDKLINDVMDIALIAITNGIKSYDTLQIMIDDLIERVISYSSFSFRGQDSKDNAPKSLADHKALLNELLIYINNNYDLRPTLREFAYSNHISSNYASHLIKQLCGRSFQDMLSEIRCMKSLQYLLDPNYHINELAHDVGFSSPAYYKKNFQKLFGVLPAKYRELFLKEQPAVLSFSNDSELISYQIKKNAKANHYTLSIMSDTSFTSHRIDTSFPLRTYENLLSDMGRISNIKTPMAEKSHETFDEMQKVFHMNVITIDINTSLKGIETPTLLTISRNINFLLDLGFTVALETKDASAATVGLITRFLDFYAHVSPNNVTRIKVLYRSDRTDEHKRHVQDELKDRILSSTGLKNEVICASDYVDEIDYIPALYDSFLLAPFAADELLNPDKWPKEIAFSLIDAVDYSGKFMAGGNGLLTWNGIKKPWWHTYMLIAKLRGSIVDQGEDHIVTNDNGRIAILTFNLCRQSPGFLESIHSTDDLNAAISQNANIRREHHFRIANIFGTYKETRYSISQSTCLYTKWFNLGFPSYLTEDEEEILSFTCQPATDFKIIDASGAINITTVEESFGVSLVILEETYDIDYTPQ